MATDWDAEAACFDAAPDHGLADPGVRAAWRALLLSRLPPPPARIADLGCGTGSLAVLLAGEGYAVGGVDLSPAMIARAREKADAAGLAVRFAVADAADPPCACTHVDAVICRHVLWALPDPAAALERWFARLAPGGTLLLIKGRWATGAGLTGAETLALLRATPLARAAARHAPRSRRRAHPPHRRDRAAG